MPKTKIDRIWDLVLELDESEDVTGIIRYSREGEGRLTVTLDGKRITVTIDEADDAKE